MTTLRRAEVVVKRWFTFYRLTAVYLVAAVTVILSLMLTNTTLGHGAFCR